MPTRKYEIPSKSSLGGVVEHLEIEVSALEDGGSALLNLEIVELPSGVILKIDTLTPLAIHHGCLSFAIL